MNNQNYPLYEVEPLANLKEMVNHTAKKYGDKPAFVFERECEIVSISYSRFKSDVEALGTVFFDMGIRNAKVGLIGENSYEWILTYFAVVNGGNVIVPLDRDLPATEIKNLINHSEASVFVFSGTYADIAEYLRENSAVSLYIDMESLGDLVEKGKVLIQQGEKGFLDHCVDDNTLTALMYTSGTTGSAKGVMLSHKNLLSNAVGTCQNILFLESGLLVLPLHHCFALNAVVLVMSISGVSVAINQSLKNTQSDLAKFKPRNVYMVPLMIETFYKQIRAAAKGSDDIELLRKIASAAFGGNISIIVSGGAPLDKKYTDGYRDLGITILEGYGLTECSAVVSVNRNQWHRDGSTGQIIPACEVKIAGPDESGHGEICVRGDIVMLGYYKNEQATREAFDGGWFRTGDIGYVDDDGFLYISGRKKNLIILSNGKNVYPEELEFALLDQIPYIKEAVVYANGNAIAAEVFLDSESTPDCAARIDGDILKFNEAQAPYKNIAKTIVRDTEFPKTTTRKIKRQYS